jgi:hypothetical protein
MRRWIADRRIGLPLLAQWAFRRGKITISSRPAAFKSAINLVNGDLASEVFSDPLGSIVQTALDSFFG